MRHDDDCKSSYMSEAWEPEWAREKRTPNFLNGASREATKPDTELWGDMPAIDVLKLEHNEGLDYSKALDVLFAASGDLRNVIETVLALPDSMVSPCTIMVNDNNFAIVRRNILLLTTALMYPSEEVGNTMVHLWYSVFLPQNLVSPFQRSVCHELRKAYDQIKGDDLHKSGTSHTILELKEARSTLETILRPSDFKEVYRPFIEESAVTFEEAQRQRRAQSVKPVLRDELGLMKYVRSPPHRLATSRFHKRGVLLPFGKSCKRFDVPNP